MNVLPFLHSPLSVRIPSPVPVAKAVVARLLRWHEGSRQRKYLAALDDRLLKDIGLTRADVQTELARHRWW